MSLLTAAGVTAPCTSHTPSLPYAHSSLIPSPPILSPSLTPPCRPHTFPFLPPTRPTTSQAATRPLHNGYQQRTRGWQKKADAQVKGIQNVCCSHRNVREGVCVVHGAVRPSAVSSDITPPPPPSPPPPITCRYFSGGIVRPPCAGTNCHVRHRLMRG